VSRYFTKPRTWIEDDLWDDEGPLIPSLTVSDHEPSDTGLLDANGDTIWRAPNPIGFGRDGEW
jgi:hypothetical protein